MNKKYKLYMAILGTTIITTLSGCNFKKQESTLPEYFVISEEIVNKSIESTNIDTEKFGNLVDGKTKVLTKKYKTNLLY